MAVDEIVREALDLRKLKLPPRPTVTAIEFEDYVDWTGDPALRVRVVLPEETEVQRITGEEVDELKWAIHRSLLARGITLFPYIFLAKPSELAKPEDED